MFTLRRTRRATAVDADERPHCSLCGVPTAVDRTGRCPLGHVVTTVEDAADASPFGEGAVDTLARLGMATVPGVPASADGDAPAGAQRAGARDGDAPGDDATVPMAAARADASAGSEAAEPEPSVSTPTAGVPSAEPTAPGREPLAWDDADPDDRWRVNGWEDDRADEDPDVDVRGEAPRDAVDDARDRLLQAASWFTSEGEQGSSGTV